MFLLEVKKHVKTPTHSFSTLDKKKLYVTRRVESTR
jgi:hypothetical protein